jgi:hypothetical protein
MITVALYPIARLRFESSRSGQAVRRSEKMSPILAEGPPMAGFCELATGLFYRGQLKSSLSAHDSRKKHLATLQREIQSHPLASKIGSF